VIALVPRQFGVAWTYKETKMLERVDTQDLPSTEKRQVHSKTGNYSCGTNAHKLSTRCREYRKSRMTQDKPHTTKRTCRLSPGSKRNG